MKRKNIRPMRWPLSSAKYQPRTSPDGLPIIDARDNAHEVLRAIVPFIFSPNIVALLCVDAGLQIDGEACLRLALALGNNYMVTVDRMCGGPGRYAIPDALLVEDDSSERADFVALLNELLALLRSGQV